MSADYELNRILAENSKLKKQVAETSLHLGGAWARCSELREENTELRELCESIYKRFRGVVLDGWSYSSDDFRMYEQRMRRLGMEVE